MLGLAILVGIISLAQVSISYFKTPRNNNPVPEVEFLTAPDSKSTAVVLSDFNPNNLDETEWKNLGFSDKQVATILKYKEVVGGEFLSKQQLKKCYAISEEKFAELEPYILLPEKFSINKTKTFYDNKYAKNKLNISRKFNPDLLSEKDWINMGFSEGQAKGILNYKNYLGGSFESKEKLKECYMISDERFSQMSPYLLLPEKSSEVPQSFTNSNRDFKEKSSVVYSPFNPNELDLEGWKALGFSEKQAQVILNFKYKNLRGSFKNLEEIKRCFVISEKKFEELKPYILLPQTITEVEKPISSNSKFIQTSTTDFSKMDLNEITYNQLLEFGFSGKAAGSFIGFRKNLGGFVNKTQIFETYNIDRELAEKLASTASLNAANVTKYTLVDAPESWLKTHPYFKYSADKIIFYRISNPDDKKIWKFIKVKPEYEAKMRMYLK